MTKPISFRPTEEAAIALAELLERTGKKRAELLNHLIMTARHGPEIVADNVRPGSASVALERMKAAGYSTARGVDHDKIAAFQRKAGMTVYDAKKRGKR